MPSYDASRRRRESRRSYPSPVQDRRVSGGRRNGYDSDIVPNASDSPHAAPGYSRRSRYGEGGSRSERNERKRESGGTYTAGDYGQDRVRRTRRSSATRRSAGSRAAAGLSLSRSGPGKRVRVPRKRRRKRRSFRLPLLILAVLAVTCFVGVHLLFQKPVQSTQLPEEPDEDMVDLVSGTDDVPGADDFPGGINPFAPEQPPAYIDPGEKLPVMVAPETAEARQERKENYFTFLLAGVDDGNGGSDTVIVVSLDAENNTIHGVSLPRDTKIFVNNKAYKLNAAYNLGGMEQLRKTVSRMLGIPIDYTVEVNLQGFVALIDAIGGVDFDVPIDMDYDDPTQNLYIGFKAGMQHLDGKDALKVVRFRHNWDGSGYGDEDYGRMRTQQNFLKTVAKKLLSPATVKDLGKLAAIFRQYVTTDLTVSNLAWLGREAITVGSDGVDFCTLSGEWRIPYVYTNKKAALDVVNERLNPYVEPRRSSDLHIAD